MLCANKGISNFIRRSGRRARTRNLWPALKILYEWPPNIQHNLTTKKSHVDTNTWQRY